jgi:hypothetical protein
VTSSWFFLSTLNYDAQSTTHQIFNVILKIDKYYFTLQVYLIGLSNVRKKGNVHSEVQSDYAGYNVDNLLSRRN